MFHKVMETNRFFYLYINTSLEELKYDSMNFKDASESMPDYFQDFLFSVDGWSITTLILFLAGFCIVVPAFGGIIWYEKYGNHRNR